MAKQERWQEELDLYKSFQTTFILEGNTLDLQPLYDEDGDLSLVTMEKYLYKKLTEMGYKTTVFFNHVDFFTNPFDAKAIKRFEKICEKSNKENKTESVGDSGEAPASGTTTAVAPGVFATLVNNATAGDSKFGDATKYIRGAMSNTDSPIAMVLNFASRYVTNAAHLDEREQYFYTELLLGSQKKTALPVGDGKTLNNIIIIVVDKLNDVPTWFYLSNPLVKPIYVTSPSKDVRREYFASVMPLLPGYAEVKNAGEAECAKTLDRFVDLTEGMLSTDLGNVSEMMKDKAIPVTDIQRGVNIYKFGIEENPWLAPDLKEKARGLIEKMRERVKGQDKCLSRVADIANRAILGLSGITHSSNSSKPRGIMFFAGPTGTGKTETAKALAEILFGSEDALIRFDMSEYSEAHSDQKLLGAPPGYVGYEEGGQLTNAVKKHPFSVLLFDEIEKASPTIMDKFLQILEDGRMTDGKGETVYFSETIIIFTSNLGITRSVFNRETMRSEKETVLRFDGEHVVDTRYEDREEPVYYDDYESYCTEIMKGVDDYFIHQAGRPEIKNRIGDNFIIFEFINKDTAKAIAKSQIKKIINNLWKDLKIRLIVTDEAYETLWPFIFANLNNGGRGVGNTIEKHLVNPLVRIFSTTGLPSDKSVVVSAFLSKDGVGDLEIEIED